MTMSQSDTNQPASSLRHAENGLIRTGSDNRGSITLADLDIPAALSGGTLCRCGRGFKPRWRGNRFCSHACYSASLRGSIEDRFWSKVNKNGPLPVDVSLGPCWLWTASKMNSYGHGQFVLGRGADGQQQHVYAHRYAYKLAHGPIPEGMNVCHKCDTPPCVRDSHFFLGTQADNLNDARDKGRLIDGLAARKLSDAAYHDILSSSDTNVAAAIRHSVSNVTICRIRRGRQGSTFHRSVRLAKKTA